MKKIIVFAFIFVLALGLFLGVYYPRPVARDEETEDTSETPTESTVEATETSVESVGTPTVVETESGTVSEEETTEAGDDEDDDWANLDPASLRWFPLKSRSPITQSGGEEEPGPFFASPGGEEEEYPDFFNIPEYPLGTMLGLAVCFAAFAGYKFRRR